MLIQLCMLWISSALQSHGSILYKDKTTFLQSTGEKLGGGNELLAVGTRVLCHASFDAEPGQPELSPFLQKLLLTLLVAKVL